MPVFNSASLKSTISLVNRLTQIANQYSMVENLGNPTFMELSVLLKQVKEIQLVRTTESQTECVDLTYDKEIDCVLYKVRVISDIDSKSPSYFELIPSVEAYGTLNSVSRAIYLWLKATYEYKECCAYVNSVEYDILRLLYIPKRVTQ